MSDQPGPKSQGRDRVRRLLVTVTAEERAAITARAASVGMSVSAYLRAAGLTQPMTSLLDHQAVRVLAGLHGALGRLETELPEIAGLRSEIAAQLERLG